MNVRAHESAKIHETAILGLPAGVFTRGEDGSRPPKEVPDFGIVIEADVIIQGCATVVIGTERPTLINRGARLLNHAHVGHDCDVGEHAIIGGGAFLCGFVQIGDRTELKARCTIRNRVRIGSDCVIGMGCAIVKDVPDNTIIFFKHGKVVVRQNRADRPWVLDDAAGVPAMPRASLRSPAARY